MMPEQPSDNHVEEIKGLFVVEWDTEGCIRRTIRIDNGNILLRLLQLMMESRIFLQSAFYFSSKHILSRVMLRTKGKHCHSIALVIRFPSIAVAASGHFGKITAEMYREEVSTYHMVFRGGKDLTTISTQTTS
ncbi:MAG: hypothetical protein A2Z74_01815 [Chloroflexi bacterium RBG_13_46_9]|nr:MAG: hypothetical protein A2Z74_01815 [Chloroflexi bacterium RBG_13_46_9]